MSKNDYVRVCEGYGRDFPSSWILTFFMIEDKVKSYNFYFLFLFSLVCELSYIIVYVNTARLN